MTSGRDRRGRGDAARAALVWACVAWLAASAPGRARAETPGGGGGEGEADGQPYVPRYQGPYGGLEPRASDWELLWGFSLLGGGALLSGVGLYALETHDDACEGAGEACGAGRGRIGGALLLGGVLLSGVGVYLVAISQPMAPRTILLEPLTAPRLGVDVELLDGGGVLRSVWAF